MGWQDEVLKSVGRLAQDALRQAGRTVTSTVKKATGATDHAGDDRRGPKLSLKYPGDYPGRPPITYSPHIGKTADPGEVVWAWVPYEDDPREGKVRPVLLVGRDGAWLVGTYLSSVDHEADAGDEARHGRHWVEIGTGAWDQQGRESSARVDRIVRVHPDDVRSRAEKLDKVRFDKVAEGIRRWA